MRNININTRVSVIGTKEAIVKALNTALKMLCRRECLIEPDDDTESINAKISLSTEVLNEFGSEFTLLDFLDDENRMASTYEDYVLSYIDEEEHDGCEDYSIRLHKVKEQHEKYFLELSSNVNECQGSYAREDWFDWCKRMARLYEVRVIWCECFYEDGCFGGYMAKDFSFKEDDWIKEDEFWPLEAWNDWYLEELAEIFELQPSEKLEYIISDYKEIVNNFNNEIERLEKKLRKVNGEEPEEKKKEEAKETQSSDDTELPW